jgi:HK97 family phage major capsid protein
MLDFSGVLQVADIIRTSTGEKLDWPMVDDTGNTGVRIGEGATEATASDPSWQRLSLYAHTYSSSVLKVSRTLLRDSIMNLVVLLGDMLGTRIGRKQNLDFTTGSGAGDAPKGIVTGSTLGVTSSVATAIAFDEIIDLEHAIDPSRRNGASYMFHDGILQVLRKLKDGEGNYLWSNGTQAGAADMINGRPFNINQDMQSTVATATKTVLFGQMNQYKVRQVDGMRMQRLIELYAATNEDGFVVHTDADGGVLNAGDNPIQHLLQS